MRTKIVTLFVLLCSSLSTTIRAQELVIDPALSATIAASTVADGIAYNQIEENQTENTTALAAVGALQTAMLEIKNTTLTALQHVHSTLQGCLAVEQCAQAVSNILNTTSEIITEVYQDPTLLAVIQPLLIKFYEELPGILTFAELAIENESGTNNARFLLNSAQRLQMINDAKKELFKLQGIMNQMRYRIKAAKKHGLFRMLCPREFFYVRHCNQIATRIINNFHF